MEKLSRYKFMGAIRPDEFWKEKVHAVFSYVPSSQ